MGINNTLLHFYDSNSNDVLCQLFSIFTNLGVSSLPWIIVSMECGTSGLMGAQSVRVNNNCLFVDDYFS